MDVLKIIEEIKLVPVVTFNKLDEVDDVLEALIEGDVKVAEICFRTDCAKEAIQKAVKDYPKLLIGAGTVINRKQAIDAISCGVKFIVSPGFSNDVYDVCQTHNIPYLPGVVTPTEIMKCLNLGMNVLKFFPAGIFGGLKAINALGAAFPQVRFMPTGGVDNSNLKEFVSNKKVFACGGSWLVKGSKEEIIKTCKEARMIIKGEK